MGYLREPSQQKAAAPPLTLAFVGMGNVARAVWNALIDLSSRFAADENTRFDINGVATRSTGILSTARPLSPAEWDQHCREANRRSTNDDIIRWLSSRPADVLIELSALNHESGEPAISYIRAAFGAGMHVVTANKGPQAFAYRALRDEAAHRRLGCRFESSVLDGMPVFRMPQAMPGCRIIRFEGIVNSTTNFILTAMEQGRSFEDALNQARAAGIAEADATWDIDGWDAAVKSAVLANVLLGEDIHPADVARQGIGDISAMDIRSYSAQGQCVRLLASGDCNTHLFEVRPQAFSLDHLYSAIRGTSNVLALDFDLFGPVTLVEPSPGLAQTAYGVIADLLAIARGELHPLQHQEAT